MHPALALLTEPRREHILRLVWDRERTAGDIASHLPVTFGAVSQHLAALRKGGLVRMRRDGRRRWYVANREALGPLAAAIEQMWFGKLVELKRLAEAAQGEIDHARAPARPARLIQHAPRPRTPRQPPSPPSPPTPPAPPNAPFEP